MSEGMDRGLTEFELIGLLRERARGSGRLRTGIGDDAAITVPRGATATTVDAVVDGVHFRVGTSSPEQIAGKAIATALSDLAAMAAEPGELYVSAGLERGTDDAFLKRLARGLTEAADRYGAVLAGGDTVASPVLFLSVTAIGHATSEAELVTRSGAGPGQLIAVTGELGGARAGQWLLEKGGEGGGSKGAEEVAGLDQEMAGLDDGTRRRLIERQTAPDPRLDAGLALGRAGATAMIDLSDGLVADLGHLARSSGVAIEIDAGRLPVAPGVDAVAVAAGRSPSGFALGGGEDYELAVALPEQKWEVARSAVEETGTRLTVIGRTGSGPPEVAATEDGRPIAPAPGHDHLA